MEFYALMVALGYLIQYCIEMLRDEWHAKRD